MKCTSSLFVILACCVARESADVTESLMAQKLIRHAQFPARVRPPPGEEIPFKCHNITLGGKNSKLSPNGTVRAETLDLILNNSAYNQVGRVLTICAPKAEAFEIPYKSFCKPTYFSVLAFIFQLQVPIVACLNRGFFEIAPALLVSFLVCLVSAYYIIPVDLWMDNPSFFSIWFSTPSILNFISLTSVAWINLLTSDLVVNYLKSLGHVTVTQDNVIVVKRFKGILQLSLLIGCGIAVFTFVMIHSEMIEGFTGLPREFSSLDKMLPFFFPSVLILTTVNIFFFVIGRAFPLKRLSNDFWSKMHEKNWVFLLLHAFLVANWIFGCLIVVGDMWSVWNMFASLSILVPALILRATCGSEKNPRQVIPEKIPVHIPEKALLSITVDKPLKCIP